MDMTQTWYATAAAAWGCYAFGIWTFRLSRGEPLFLAVAKMALVACPVILSCFGIHATRQYQVVLAVHKLPLVEVANSDNGRERIIERIRTSDGIGIEREHIAGWRLVSNEGHRRTTNWSLSSGDAGDPGSGCCTESSDREGKGCICGLLEMPGCCNGRCSDCICNQLEIAGNSRQF